MNRRTIILGVALALAALSAAACGSSMPKAAPYAASHSSPSARAAPTATAPPSSSGYPQQAADKALCSAYQSDSTSGDLQAMAQAVQQAGSSVSPVLAHDIMNVVNNPGSVSQDEHNMIYVAMDCGVVAAGKPPVELNKVRRDTLSSAHITGSEPWTPPSRYRRTPRRKDGASGRAA